MTIIYIILYMKLGPESGQGILGMVGKLGGTGENQ